MWQALEMQNSSKKVTLKRSKASQKQEIPSRDYHWRQTLVFKWDSALQEKFVSFLQEIFTSTDKIFISGGWVLGSNFIKFRYFTNID